MRTSAERKEIARKFQREHVGSGKRSKAWAFYDDDQETEITRHDHRGIKTIHLKPVQEEIKSSTTFARRLVDDAEKEFSFDNRINGVGTRPAENPSAPLVVVDTSVITRAIGTNQQEDCRKIVDLATDGKIIPCVTPPLVNEYLVVVGRGELSDNVRFDGKSRQLLEEFLTRCLPLSGRPATFPATIKEDPSDDILLIAQAIAQEQRGKPCAIVSRDKHILSLHNARKSDILHPVIFLARLAAAFPQSLLDN